MKKFKVPAILMILTVFLTACHKDDAEKVEIKTVNFENLSTGNQGYWNGSDLAGDFTSAGITFSNHYSTSFGSWEGFAYSQKADVSTPGFGNQFSVFDAANGSNKFAIYYPPFGSDAYASFSAGTERKIRSIDVCNVTYSALSMKDGDGFAKKFGGNSGNDPDWYKLTVIGYDAAGDSIGAVNFYLADYRFSNNSKDYILNKWTPVDLTALGKVNKITFRFSSTDNGTWGMNTPATVCLDNIKYEEPVTVL
jgi:hypothetical protein